MFSQGINQSDEADGFNYLGDHLSQQFTLACRPLVKVHGNTWIGAAILLRNMTIEDGGCSKTSGVQHRYLRGIGKVWF